MELLLCPITLESRQKLCLTPLIASSLQCKQLPPALSSRASISGPSVLHTSPTTVSAFRHDGRVSFPTAQYFNPVALLQEVSPSPVPPDSSGCGSSNQAVPESSGMSRREAPHPYHARVRNAWFFNTMADNPSPESRSKGQMSTVTIVAMSTASMS